jgi:hypothetical protein
VKRVAPLLAAALALACNESQVDPRPDATPPLASSVTPDSFASACAERGLDGKERDACVLFQRRMAEPPSCPPYPPPQILHYETECPILAERDVPRPGRMSVEANEPALRHLFEEHRRPFLDCYSAALRRDPELAGTVRLDFVWDRAGGLTNVVPSSRTIDEAYALDCIVRVAASFHSDEKPRETAHARVALAFLP